MSAPIIPKAVPLAITVIIGDSLPVILQARMTSPTAVCPVCGCPSGRVQSHYWRTLQDLPWQAIPVRWLLACRRFWCETPTCARTIFCERLPPTWAGVRQRRTAAVWDWMTAWGWTASAADVADVATRQGLPISADTVIRALRRVPDPPVDPVRVVGVDEWAKRKGQTYATILVDQERHRIVDVLPDDRSDTVAAWLQEHPTIQVVTRDRDDAFARAIAAGAPDAMQVADRFHLLQNLRAVLERVFHRVRRPEPMAPPPAVPGPVATPPDPEVPVPPPRRSRMERRAQVQALTLQGYSQTAIAARLGIDRRTVRQDAAAPPIAIGPPPLPGNPTPDGPPPPDSPAHARRQAQWREIRERRVAGQSISTIARALHRDRATVRHYAQAESPPQPAPRRTRRGSLSGWTAQLVDGWSTGTHHAQALWSLLQQDGYRGGVAPVRRWVRHHRQQLRGGLVPAPPAARLHPRRLAWCCLQRMPDWSPQTARTLLVALEDPQVREAYTLTHLFRTLVKYRRPAALEPWIRRAEASPLPEFQRFARGLRTDLPAVTAAIREPWSQGPVEGFNCKIKRTKRLMYGRGSFDLLRTRILHAP